MNSKDNEHAGNDPQASGKSACWADAALEELAQLSICGAAPQTPDDERRVRDLAAHVDACPECRERADCIRDHFSRVGQALCEAEQVPAEACPEPETLAVYLDGSYEEQERSALERHLALCRRCRERLCRLYRETRAVLDPTVAVEVVERVPAGERVVFEAARDSESGPETSAPGAQSPSESPETGERDEGRKQRFSSR